MLLRLFSILVLLVEVRISMSKSSNVMRVEVVPPVRTEKPSDTMTYDNYSSSVLSILSRDFTVLQKSIDAIEGHLCRDHVQLILNNMRNLTTWAMKFYDSTGKFSDGLLTGSFYFFGNFEECLDIGNDNGTPKGINGQYCLTEVEIDVPESYLNVRGSVWEFFKNATERYETKIHTLRWGICAPVSCTTNDIANTIERIILTEVHDSQLNITAKIPEYSCQKRESRGVSAVDIIYLCIIVSVISTVIIGTLFHAAYLWRKEGVPAGIVPEILTAFSFIFNVKKLLSPAHQTSMHLNCIAGIKVLSMMFIISGHSSWFGVSGPLINTKYIKQAVQSVHYSIILNNTLLVDSFLLLSAFLFSRLVLHELDKRKTLNFFYLYIFRYVRLTPAYFVIIAFYITWFPKIGSGPMWFRIETERDRCRSSWWANLLYINNYVKTDKLCMFQSWYLAVDTQLFIIAPAIIYPLWRWRKIGVHLLLTIIVISTLIPFLTTFYYKTDPTLMFSFSEIQDISLNEYFKNNCIKTHMRIQVYCIGLLFGYILYEIQTSGQNLSKRIVQIGWIISIISMIASMFSIVLFYGPRKHFTIIESAIYAAIHRLLWSVGVGWIIIACVTGNGEVIKAILNWPFFVPFSRLTYSVYLVNGVIELYSLGVMNFPRQPDTYTMLNLLVAHLVFTVLAAFFLSIVFESPILNLERIFLRKGSIVSSNKNTPKKDESDPETNIPGS